MGQRVLLLAAWLVSCGFVYVLGVYLGKGLRGDSGEIAPRVALPVEITEPPPPPAEAQAPLTFYDVLGANKGGPPAPAAAKPHPSTLTEEKLSPSQDASKGVAPAAVPVEPPSAGSPPQVAVAPPPEPIPSPVVAAPAPAVVPSPPVASPTQAAAPAMPAQAVDGRWTVYANPTRDRLAVDHERAALRAKGYPAEVVTLRRDNETWYRIRVGRYATQSQAEEASRRLRSDGVGHAFVQSE
jgi:cell division protein FtsN